MNRRELAKYLWRAESGIEERDEEFTSEWEFYGTLRLASSVTYRQARRVLSRWSEEMKEENLRLGWIAVIECARPPRQVSLHVLVGGGNGKLKERCFSKWQSLGVTPVSLLENKRGAFCPFVIEAVGDRSTFDVAMDFHYGWFSTDERYPIP